MLRTTICDSDTVTASAETIARRPSLSSKRLRRLQLRRRGMPPAKESRANRRMRRLGRIGRRRRLHDSNRLVRAPIADVDAWSGDELGNLRLVSSAERAAKPSKEHTHLRIGDRGIG